MPVLHSYRNQLIDLHSKSIDWFLYEGNTGTSWVKDTFIPSTIIEWNKLDSNIHSFPSNKLFRKWLLEFIRTRHNSTFNVPNTLGLTYLTRLRVGLSHLREHKFCHTIWDSLNLLCNCDNAIESIKHYLLLCPNFKNKRLYLLQNVEIVNPNLLSMNEVGPTYYTYYYGSNNLTDNTNTSLLNSVTEYITWTKRFSNPLIL